MVSLMSERSTAEDWLDFGLTVLTNEGPGALKADVLAKARGVSRGSFYWHFKNLKDFHARLLARWRERSTGEVIEDINELEGGQLAALMQRAFSHPHQLERALRAWSVHSEEARRVVEAVDTERIAYIEALLRGAGAPQDRAPARARFIYWAYLGRIVCAHRPPKDEEVIALAELLLQPQPTASGAYADGRSPLSSEES